MTKMSSSNNTSKVSKQRFKKKCSAPECSKTARWGYGVCVRHGAKEVAKKCRFEGCKNNSIRGGVCRSHGAQAKTCSHEGCSKNVVSSGVCRRHGAKVKAKKCSFEGCSNYSVKGGVCRSHGARAKNCSHEGCKNKVVNSGVCLEHGAKVAKRKMCNDEEGINNNNEKVIVNSSISNDFQERIAMNSSSSNSRRKISDEEGINNNNEQVIVNSSIINESQERIAMNSTSSSSNSRKISKSTTKKKCSILGCNTQARSGYEVCVRHGAKEIAKKCRHEGCKNNSIRGGVCRSHGAEAKTCSHKGCKNKVVNRGICLEHGAKVAKRKSCISKLSDSKSVGGKEQENKTVFSV